MGARNVCVACIQELAVLQSPGSLSICKLLEIQQPEIAVLGCGAGNVWGSTSQYSSGLNGLWACKTMNKYPVTLFPLCCVAP